MQIGLVPNSYEPGQFTLISMGLIRYSCNAAISRATMNHFMSIWCVRVFHYVLLKYCHENAEMQKRKFDDVTLRYSILPRPGPGPSVDGVGPSTAVQLVLVEKDLCCSLSLETCKREQHIIWNHMTDKRTILEYDSSSYWCARGGGGVALTQLSGRYVPPEVKKVGSAERKYLHQNTSL